jgi:hypothetical protein
MKKVNSERELLVYGTLLSAQTQFHNLLVQVAVVKLMLASNKCVIMIFVRNFRLTRYSFAVERDLNSVDASFVGCEARDKSLTAESSNR